MSVSNILSEKRMRKYRKVFADSGWKLNSKVSDIADKFDDLDGPAFYLCDVESGQLFIVATIKEAFSLAEAQKLKSNISFQAICDAFGSLYTDVCSGKVKLDEDVSNLLSIAASMYITGTQGYRIAQERGIQSAHYLILRHWDHSANTALLRPVPITTPGYQPPEMIEALVDHILAIDRSNHPERFKSAKVLPFKIKNRIGI